MRSLRAHDAVQRVLDETLTPESPFMPACAHGKALILPVTSEFRLVISHPTKRYPQRLHPLLRGRCSMCSCAVIMVRYAPLVSQRPKPSRVIGRMRAASALSATTSVFRRLQRCCEWCRERRVGMCLRSVRALRSYLSILQSPCAWRTLPDATVHV